MGNHTPVDGNLQEISSSATSANPGRMAMCHLIGRRRAAMKRRYSFRIQLAKGRSSLPFHRRGMREMPRMPTQLPPREPGNAHLLIRCGRYFAGIAILLVALVLFKLRFVRASHATARLGERIGDGSPVFS